MGGFEYISRCAMINGCMVIRSIMIHITRRLRDMRGLFINLCSDSLLILSLDDGAVAGSESCLGEVAQAGCRCGRGSQGGRSAQGGTGEEGERHGVCVYGLAMGIQMQLSTLLPYIIVYLIIIVAIMSNTVAIDVVVAVVVLRREQPMSRYG